MILIFIEVREGKVKKSSLEALSEGKRRADDLNTEANYKARCYPLFRKLDGQRFGSSSGRQAGSGLGF
jgi:hypothetical protein